MIAQHSGADSASVLFDALEAARARGVDVLIADTAGRLQNKSHLMDELSKVVRVMRKQDDTVPHETLLVLDAGTGQNAVSQAVEFDQAVGVSGGRGNQARWHRQGRCVVCHCPQTEAADSFYRCG